MANPTYTPNYNLVKPDPNDFYDVNQFNSNAEIIDSELKKISDSAGNLTNLNTEQKTNLVDAINELLTKIGNTTSLTTDEKSNLVAAVNEIKQQVTAHLAEDVKHITQEEREAWNQAESNAKAYVDQKISSGIDADKLDGLESTQFVKRINLTSSVQTNSYRKSIIALCSITDINSYSAGTLTFHRDNGLYGMGFINIAIEKRYSEENINVSMLSYGFNPYGIKPCTFTYNGEKYGGIELYVHNANAYYVEFMGTGNFDIFGLDYYDTENDQPINAEIANSINYDVNYIGNLLFNGEEIGGGNMVFPNIRVAERTGDAKNFTLFSVTGKGVIYSIFARYDSDLIYIPSNIILTIDGVRNEYTTSDILVKRSDTGDNAVYEINNIYFNQSATVEFSSPSYDRVDVNAVYAFE